MSGRLTALCAIALLLVSALPTHAAATGSSGTAARQREPGPADTIIVDDVATYWTPANSVIIVGFMTNTGAEPVTDIEVTASLIGKYGEDVATTRADLRPRFLLPGARAPWRAEVPNAPWQQGARARAGAMVADPVEVELWAAPLHLSEVRLSREETVPYASRLRGRLTNTSDQTVSHARVLGALIAFDGRSVAVDQDQLSFDALLPGESASFDLEFRLGSLPMIADYRLVTEASIRR